MDLRVAIIKPWQYHPEKAGRKSRQKKQAERQTRPPMRDYKEIAGRIADDFGANATYVEDLLRQFQHNPNSVDEEWSDYFQSLLGGDGSVKVESRTTNGAATATVAAEQPAPAVTPMAVSAPQPAPTVAETTVGERIPIRGLALRIVENMESS